MSRAFVKEPDGNQAEDDLPDLPQRLELNYITPDGFRKLNCRYQDALDQSGKLKLSPDNLATNTEKINWSAIFDF